MEAAALWATASCAEAAGGPDTVRGTSVLSAEWLGVALVGGIVAELVPLLRKPPPADTAGELTMEFTCELLPVAVMPEWT